MPVRDVYWQLGRTMSSKEIERRFAEAFSDDPWWRRHIVLVSLAAAFGVALCVGLFRSW